MGDFEGELSPDEEELGQEAAASSSDLLSLLGHFYRGQMDRVTTWRTRMDETTKWAVTIMAAILTWAFSSADNPHYIILVGMLTVVVFLGIETRRYQAYDVWRSRLRMVEQDLFATTFDPNADLEHADWREKLSKDLREPAVKMSGFQALSRRLRRVYLPLLYILLAAWLFRIFAFEQGTNWRAVTSISGIPAIAVVAAVVTFYIAITAIAFWPHSEGGELQKTDESD